MINDYHFLVCDIFDKVHIRLADTDFASNKEQVLQKQKRPKLNIAPERIKEKPLVQKKIEVFKKRNSEAPKIEARKKQDDVKLQVESLIADNKINNKKSKVGDTKKASFKIRRNNSTFTGSISDFDAGFQQKTMNLGNTLSSSKGSLSQLNSVFGATNPNSQKTLVLESQIDDNNNKRIPLINNSTDLFNSTDTSFHKILSKGRQLPELKGPRLSRTLAGSNATSTNMVDKKSSGVRNAEIKPKAVGESANSKV